MPSSSEKKNIAAARKSLVAACRIQKGELFTSENITAKRPGDGLSPMRYHEILGQVADRDYEEDEQNKVTENKTIEGKMVVQFELYDYSDCSELSVMIVEKSVDLDCGYWEF